MTYSETLDWLFTQLPMYQNKGAIAFTGKLDNMLHCMDYLGHPERQFKSIHVAGTNGKGSSSHMLASILQEAGYKVGLHTSPHLKDYRERIKINGKMVDKGYVTAYVNSHRTYFESRSFSFFEMTVAMAFSYFALEKVDIAIVEVGMGGRLDSTNILRPEASLITNIGYDHTQFLGETLSAIAAEKAGIIKEGVPVVISEQQNQTTPVFTKIAEERNTDITFADDLEIPEYKTDLLGNYQTKNSKGVIACLGVLKGYGVTTVHIENGLKKVVQNTGLRGRWQVLSEAPKIICDTAHNKEGLTLVLQQLLQEDYNHLHIVLGFVKDKALQELLRLLPKEASYYLVSPKIPRALAIDQLSNQIRKFNLKVKEYSSVKEGLNAAQEAATPNDIVFVGGSTFVVAEIL